MAHSTLFLAIAIFLLQYNALCFSLSVPNDEVGEPVPPSMMLSKVIYPFSLILEKYQVMYIRFISLLLM